MKIVIDPGHGAGVNLYPDGSHSEGTQMFYLAYYLYQELKKLGRYNLKMTRLKQDENPAVDKRGKMAADADLFISLHSNAAASNTVQRVVVIPNISNQETGFREFCQNIGEAVKNSMAIKEATQIFDRSYQDVNTGRVMNYYAVLRNANEVGCKNCLIVEHSFHTTPFMASLLCQDPVLKLIARKEAEVIDAFLTPAAATPATYWGHDGDEPVTWRDLWEILHDADAE